MCLACCCGIALNHTHGVAISRLSHPACQRQPWEHVELNQCQLTTDQIHSVARHRAQQNKSWCNVWQWQLKLHPYSAVFVHSVVHVILYMRDIDCWGELCDVGAYQEDHAGWWRCRQSGSSRTSHHLYLYILSTSLSFSLSSTLSLSLSVCLSWLSVPVVFSML